MFLKPLDFFQGHRAFEPSLLGIRRLQREIDHLWRAERSTNAVFPRVRIAGNEEGVQLEAFLPGVDTTNLEITLNGERLTLKGKRELPAAEGKTLVREEFFSGDFERSFQLPFRVEEADVKATYKAGVLSLSLPKAAAEKPRKIEIAVK